MTTSRWWYLRPLKILAEKTGFDLLTPSARAAQYYCEICNFNSSKKSNYDTAKNALGNLSKSYEVDLKGDQEYQNKSPKDKLVYIINKAREDFRKSSIDKAKSIVGEKVESLRVNKSGELTNDKRSRKLTDKEKVSN